ncbi:hypothetical protein CEXT_5021 [Caerostris extrusa]|uniref:Uncharacterized protein n=1 Tax=Caerostris extrusa TaxID=172846 RepID=A0AAV4VTX5_CAEEX|nr:hypothetical protein CEXT_5021 [Caerostris extrusa]
MRVDVSLYIISSYSELKLAMTCTEFNTTTKDFIRICLHKVGFIKPENSIYGHCRVRAQGLDIGGGQGIGHWWRTRDWTLDILY